MRRQLLLFALLLAGLTSAYATEATLSIANVQHAAPGYKGSFDIVLSGGDVRYSGYQFDLTLPDGLTYTSFEAGELLTGYSALTVTQPTGYAALNKWRFLGYDANGPLTLSADNGKLLTVYFSVDEGTSVGNVDATFSEINFTDIESNNHVLTAGSGTIAITKNVLLDEDATTAPAALDGATVTVNRSFAAGQWLTVCLPFAMTASQVTTTFGSGVKLGDFAGYEKVGTAISVNFTSATAIVANHPYIIKVESAVDGFTLAETVDIAPVANPMNNKGDNADTDIKAIVGVYNPTTLDANMLYLKSGSFKYSAGSSKLKGYRAYFNFCDFDPSADSRTLTIDYLDQATGIHELNRLDTDDSRSFDLQGRPMKSGQKGVRIVNGKKILNK